MVIQMNKEETIKYINSIIRNEEISLRNEQTKERIVARKHAIAILKELKTRIVKGDEEDG